MTPWISHKTRILSSIGIISAGLIALLVNIFAARHYRRFDATHARIYTLSQPTQVTLESLESTARDVELFVFIGSADPLLSSVRAMLQNYQSYARKHLHIRYLDPDRDRAQFIRLKAELDVNVGKVENGRIVADAQIVARYQQRIWYVKTDDLLVVEEHDDTKVRPRIETALTGAIRAVLSTDRPRICFTTGHHEASINDPNKEGLSTLKNLLSKDNFLPESIDLSLPNLPVNILESCALIAVLSPNDPFKPEHVRPMVHAVQRGSALLLAVPPAIDLESKTLRAHGLQDVAQLAGVVFDDAVTIELDSTLREPNGLGLIFQAKVHSHSTTNDLQKFAEARGGEATIPLAYARPMRRVPSNECSNTELLVSTDKSFAMHDLNAFLASKDEPKQSSLDPNGPFDLAVAAERKKEHGGSKIIVVGASTPFLNMTYLDPSPRMIQTRHLGLLWISWLTARPPILDLPPKSSVQIALHLSEEDLSSIGRYVLLYMPLAIALMGGAVWLRRRSTEGKKSQRLSTK